MSVIAFDVGGTHLRSALFADGVLSSRRDLVTPTAGPSAFLEGLISEGRVQQRAADRAGGTPPTAIGLAMAGYTDTRSGRVYDSPSLGLADTLVGPPLHEALGLPVRLVNDVNAAAWAEAHAADARHLVALLVGTGVGTGCVSDGLLVEGQRGMAAEGGHVIWKPDGLICDCGVRGCFQAYLGGRSLGRRAAQAGLADDAAALFASHRAGDERAAPIVADAIAAMGSLCRLLVTLFDPGCLVVAGGVGMHTPELMEAARRVLDPHPLASRAGAIPVTPAVHGADAGLIGAALLAGALHA